MIKEDIKMFIRHPALYLATLFPCRIQPWIDKQHESQKDT